MTAAERNRPVTGVMMLLAAVTMLFAAFTSAMVVRRGLSGDWVSTPLPHILWLNTVLLAASSFVLREAPTSRTAAVRKRFAVALGILFLAGQLEAWRELNAAGVYLPSNPAASFFYILTTVHAVHVIGAADGNFPSDMALNDPDGLEEERRLFYVAITRPRKTLAIYVPLRYYHHPNARDDNHGYGKQSRFITPEAESLCERTDTLVPETSVWAGGDPAAAKVDVDLAHLWR